MLMLEDLKKRTNLIQNLGKAIEDDGYQTIISKGKLHAHNYAKPIKEKKHYETLFNSSDLVFAGVSHSKIMGPIFALVIEKNNHCAALKEYLTISRKSEKIVEKKLIAEELTALAIVVSIFYPEILKIQLPIEIKEFNNQECEVKKFSHECFLYIKKPPIHKFGLWT
jgi:hypothetical protein